MRSIHEITDEGRNIKDFVLKFLVGDMIGEGAYRRVYEMGKPDEVLKVEHCGREFCNPTEWKVWQAVEHTPIAEWFAPCVDIDMWGIALIQKRTKGFDSEAEFNAYIEKHHGGTLPSFFDDIHYGNFGLLEGRLVCHDYGFNHFLDEAAKMEWQQVVNEKVKRPSQALEEQLALPL